MSKYVMLLLLCFISNYSTSAKIKNGYGTDLKKVQQALLNLQQLLDKTDGPQLSPRLSFKTKKKIESKIDWLNDYMAYYQLTEKLLQQFIMIAPDLYREIDTITDSNNRSVDVYVKFVPVDEMPVGVAGTTNINQSKHDPNAYFSEYGIHTVSLKVGICKRSLRLLAHELGHVKYQVPNLALYMSHYQKYYGNENSTVRGHYSSDPSGKQAHLYEKRMDEHYKGYLKNNKDKIRSPLVILEKIRNTGGCCRTIYSKIEFADLVLKSHSKITNYWIRFEMITSYLV